jgi:hypothetical protein
VGSEGVGSLSLDDDGEGDFSLYLWRGWSSSRVWNMNPQRVQRAETQMLGGAAVRKTRTRAKQTRGVWVLAWWEKDLWLVILLLRYSAGGAEVTGTRTWGLMASAFHVS